MILRCEVCREKIARFDEDTIHAPLTADQFRPLVEGKSHHSPFREDVKFWTCPICHKRPFNSPKRLYTENGYVDVPEIVKDEHLEAVVSQDEAENMVNDAPMKMYESGIIVPSKLAEKIDEIVIPEPTTFPKYMCKICGKDCGSKIGLTSHMRHKHK